MAGNTYSGPGFIRLNGVTVLKNAKITAKVMSGNTDVDLLLEGHDGHNRGPAKVQIDIEGAVPQSGLVVDWLALCNSGIEVPLDFVMANQEMQCIGDIRDSEKGTTITGNNVTCSFHGKWLNAPTVTL